MSRVDSAPILPGATVGVLGSGQLGRMFAIAARRMGYRVHTYSPEYDTPTGQVADLECQGAYDDLEKVRAFSQAVSVVTFEFENVSSEAAAVAGECAPVRPSGSVLHVTQHRLREKTFLRDRGFPVTPFRVVRSLEDLPEAVAELGRPCVLKSAGFGYDGKGQVKITEETALEAAWAGAGRSECVLEAWVDFACELSVVAARGLDGGFAHYVVTENTHQNHILDVTLAPSQAPPEAHAEAIRIARGVLEELDVVGVLCVEYFLTKSGALLVNELAPRPHNSGHFSFDACVTSQFEQQLRAICGLQLGSTELLRPAAMANLLGDLWQAGTPDWSAVCAQPDIKLHLYGKSEPRPGRKMGHLTAMAATSRQAGERVRHARNLLAPKAHEAALRPG